MSEKTLLLCCSFGLPFLLIALIIGAVGFVLRRVRPDLYMTDEEKEAAQQKQWQQAAEHDGGTTNDNNKEKI
ncbi:MAG: hypothetical protein IJ723_08475 [Ruminococcus sp.]|nr:hypothetical protein [Ruminococcus sp.]